MKLQPSFFDIFGVVGFVAIMVIALTGLLNDGLLPRWMLVVLLHIGIIGFVVDIVIVYKTYFKK